MEQLNELGYQIIGAAFEVQKALGPFLFENIYEQALQYELERRGIHSRRQVYMSVLYKGKPLDKAYVIDLIVENKICVECKAIETMGEKEICQLSSYLYFSGYKLGYLINFHAKDFTTAKIGDNKILTKGIYRIINTK